MIKHLHHSDKPKHRQNQARTNMHCSRQIKQRHHPNERTNPALRGRRHLTPARSGREMSRAPSKPAFLIHAHARHVSAKQPSLSTAENCLYPRCRMHPRTCRLPWRSARWWPRRSRRPWGQPGSGRVSSAARSLPAPSTGPKGVERSHTHKHNRAVRRARRVFMFDLFLAGRLSTFGQKKQRGGGGGVHNRGGEHSRDNPP
jgi:hypothetical protein